MNNQELKIAIEKLAIELNIGFIEAAQALQAQAAKLENEALLEQIQKIKMDYYFSK